MTHEYIELKATLHSLDDKRYDCGACLSSYRGRADEDAMVAAVKKQKGCAEAFSEPVHIIEDTIKFKKCIGNYVSAAAYHWIEMFGYFSRGMLPFPGAISEQPSKAIEVFNVIESHRASSALRRAQEQQRATLRRGKRGR